MKLIYTLFSFQGFLFLPTTQLSLLMRIVLFIFLYLSGGVLLSYQDLYYLGLTYIIVYVGAIAIQFLFILMILNINQSSQRILKRSQVFSALLTYATVQAQKTDISYVLPTSWFVEYWTVNDIYSLSQILFLGYSSLLLYLGILLFIIFIGILSIGTK